MKLKTIFLKGGLLVMIGILAGCDAGESKNQSETSIAGSTVKQQAKEFSGLSDQSVIYFFGDQNWAFDKDEAVTATSYLGSNAANYLASGLYTFYEDKSPSFYNYATVNATIQDIKSAVTKNVGERSALKPDLLIIQLGDNDAAAYATGDQASSPDAYRQGLEEMLTKAVHAVNNVVVVGPFSTQAPKESFRKETFEKYQKIAAEVCAAFGQVEQVEFQTELDRLMETDEVTYQPKQGLTVLKPQTQMKLSSAILSKLNILELSGRKKVQNVFNENTVVMFAGDSVTDCYRDTRIFPGMNTGKGHATNISAYLDAVYGNVTVLNAGVAGATSGSMLSRFHDDVLDFEPDYLVMMIGINDAYSLWVGEATDIDAVRQAYEANLREMLTASVGIKKVLMITPYYVEEKATSGKRKQFVDYIQQIARKVSAEFDNVMMLDIQEVFDQKIKEITFSSISLDRVHLTPYGYQILTAEVLNKLGW